ncbi:MAG: AAA family ATPase [Caldilineaceae bacterium]
MAFKKMDKTVFPPRQWALVGYPGSGKSTFAAQMVSPMLVVDADHRFAEVARLATGEIFQLSEEPSDNVNAERIAALLKENMSGSGIKTVVIDSLTSILSPLIVEAILDNDAGRNKNRVASFKDKALTMRLLQDTITGWGVDTLWIYHLRTGLDGQAREVESSTISVVELARLRRSLNMQLRIIEHDDRRGLHIDWARRGRSGLTLWDDSGSWHGMPEKIEAAVYGGLTTEQMNAFEKQAPTSFSGPEEAIAWGVEQGVFRDAVHAKNAYDKVKSDRKPKTAADMWRLWIEDVEKRQPLSSEEQEQRAGALQF